MANLVAATATIDVNADPAATDTVTIGDITYTFIATPAAAYDVDVGANLAASVANLAAAINRSGTPGATTYHTDTVQNPYVKAEVSGDDIVLTARIPGTVGNGITVGTSEVDIIILDSEVTLTGGTGDLAEELRRSQLNSQQLQIFQNLVEA